MAAPVKNQNAAKAEADKATSFLHIRVVPREKSAWVRAANRRGKKLAEWVTDSLNRAASLEEVDSEDDLV